MLSIVRKNKRSTVEWYCTNKKRGLERSGTSGRLPGGGQGKVKGVCGVESQIIVREVAPSYTQREKGGCDLNLFLFKS